MSPARLIPLLTLTLLTACAQQPAHNVIVEEQSDCPMQLHTGQNLTLTLPSRFHAKRHGGGGRSQNNPK